MQINRCVNSECSRAVCMHAGGALVCAGPEYDGSFVSCIFQGCAVHAVNGAAVSLRRCTFRRCHPAIVSSQPHTLTTIADCEFHDCPVAIVTEAGAATATRESHVYNAAAAFIVNDPGSHSIVDHCTALASPSVWKWNFGALVCGGVLCMLGCSLYEFSVAVAAHGTASAVEMRKCSASKCRQGLLLADRALVTARDSAFDRDRENDSRAPVDGLYSDGVTLRGDDPDAGRARAQLDRCRVSGATDAVCLTHRGSATLVLCHLVQCENAVSLRDEQCSAVLRRCEAVASNMACLAMKQRSGVRAEDCRLTGVAGACAAMEGARLDMKNCQLAGLSRPTWAGVVSVVEKSTATLAGCVIADGAVGVQVIDSTVTARGCAVSNMRALGNADDANSRFGAAANSQGPAYMCNGGRMRVRGGSVWGCSAGVATRCDLDGQPGSVTIHGVVFERYGMGVNAQQDCEAHVSECEFRGHASGASRPGAAKHVYSSREIWAQAGVRLVYARGGSVRGCIFEGHRFDVVCEVRSTVPIHGCKFLGTVSEGTCIVTDGGAEVEDCSFANSQYAITLRKSRGCVRRSSFGPGINIAVVAAEAGVVSVSESTFRKCMVAVAIQEHSSAELTDSRISDAQMGVTAVTAGSSITARGLTLTGKGEGILVGCGAEPPVRAELVGCTLTGVGVNVSAMGTVATLLRCKISGASRGLSVAGTASVRLKESAIVSCATGIFVGDTDTKIKRGCDECGRSGDAAMEVALRAIHAAGGHVDPRPRCTHNGGLARLAVEDTEVAKCSQEGLAVHLGGRVSAARLRVSRCRVGYSMWYVGTASEFRECTVAKVSGQVAVATLQQVGDDLGKRVRGSNIPGVTEVSGHGG